MAQSNSTDPLAQTSLADVGSHVQERTLSSGLEWGKQCLRSTGENLAAGWVSECDTQKGTIKCRYDKGEEKLDIIERHYHCSKKSGSILKGEPCKRARECADDLSCHEVCGGQAALSPRRQQQIADAKVIRQHLEEQTAIDNSKYDSEMAEYHRIRTHGQNELTDA